jgi:hypothetical protein
MSASDSDELLALGLTYSPARLLVAAIGGFIVGLFEQIIGILDTLVGLFTDPAGALSGGSANLITALFAANVQLLQGAARTTVATIAPGGTFAQAVGPLALLFGVAEVLAIAFLFVQFTALEASSGAGLLGTGIDPPTPGFTTAEEEEEG